MNNFSTQCQGWRETKAGKWLAVVLALQVPLSIYILPGTTISLYFFVTILAIFITSRAYNKRKSITKPIKIFTLSFIGLNLLSFLVHNNDTWFNGGTVMNNTLIQLLSFLLIMVWYENRLSMRMFIKTVTLVALLASVIAIYQRFSFMVTGSYFNEWFIPGLETSREGVAFAAINERPAAFFTEPSHLAQYLLPVALFHLQKHNIWKSVVIVLGILASGSTNGLVGLLVIFFLVFVMGKMHNLKDILLLTVFIALVAWLYSAGRSFFDAGLNKVEYMDEDNIRLLGSMIIFENFHLSDWLFGIGFGNRTNFLIAYGQLFRGEYMYANTYVGLLSDFGIIGLTVFVWFIVQLFKRCTKGYTNAYLILFLVLCSSIGMLFSGYMILYMTFIMNSNEIAAAETLKRKLY